MLRGTGTFPGRMGQEPQPRGSLSEVYRYSGLGCSFAAAVLVFVGLGWLLDRALGLTPLFMVVGALVGTALASVSLYRKLGLGRPPRGRERP